MGGVPCRSLARARHPLHVEARFESREPLAVGRDPRIARNRAERRRLSAPLHVMPAARCRRAPAEKRNRRAAPGATRRTGPLRPERYTRRPHDQRP
jgi:hypothetical protein